MGTSQSSDLAGLLGEEAEPGNCTEQLEVGQVWLEQLGISVDA